MLDKAKFAASFAADVEPEKADFMANSQVPWGLDALTGLIQPAWKNKRAGTRCHRRQDDPAAGAAVHVQRAGSSVVELKGSTRSMYPSPSRRDAHEKQPGRLCEVGALDVAGRLSIRSFCRRLPSAAVRRKSPHTDLVHLAHFCPCRSLGWLGGQGPDPADNLPPATAHVLDGGQPARHIRPIRGRYRARRTFAGADLLASLYQAFASISAQEKPGTRAFMMRFSRPERFWSGFCADR